MNLKADVVGLLVKQMKREGLPQPIREHRFHPTRKWQFDLAYPDLKLAFEYEGGIWVAGRHNRGGGYAKDIEKYNTAALMGWRVFRMYGDMIFKGQREMDEGWKLIQDVLFEFGPFFFLDGKLQALGD